MIHNNSKFRSSRPEFGYLFEGNAPLSPLRMSSSLQDMRLAFDAEICQSTKVKFTLDPPEPWPVNSIPITWYESFSVYCCQPSIQIHSNREVAGLAFDAEIFQYTKPKNTMESFETFPVHFILGAGPKNGNDYC